MSQKERYPTQPSLVGRKVYLRPATADDILSHHTWFVQSEPQTQSCRPHPFRSASETAEAYKKKEKSPYDQRFAIVRKTDKLLVGSISFFNYNNLNRSAELGILIDPDERKNGFAQDAMKTLIGFLFLQRDLYKVHAQTWEKNSGSIKLLESIGFSRDGVLRNHHFHNGEFSADYIYSLLRAEVDW
ncbi:MAG: GNAT family protein [bacterium]|nr:GNAT family protein [bacterium]